MGSTRGAKTDGRAVGCEDQEDGCHLQKKEVEGGDGWEMGEVRNKRKRE